MARKGQNLHKIKWEQEIPQAIGDKQHANYAQDFPTVLDQGIPQAIGDEQHAKPHTRHSNHIGARTPQVIGGRIAQE